MSLIASRTSQGQVLEQDSLALVAFYHATGGDHWTDNTNWLKPGQNVSTWVGIGLTLDGTRVETIALDNNNLSGEIPEEIGDLYGLIFLGVTSTHMSGTIPASINNIDKLVNLVLYNNDYTGEIPAFLFQVPPPDEGGYQRAISLENNFFSGVENWGDDFRNVSVLFVENNCLDFADIEYFLSETIPVFSYSPQRPIYTVDEITVREGAMLTLKTSAGGSANHYQWFKDAIPVASATQADHSLLIAQADEGEYTAEVTSDIVTDLTLYRNPITVQVKEDTLYRSCDGSSIVLEAAVSDPEAVYLWSTGATGSSIVANVSGKYGVRIETGNFILKDTLEVDIDPKLSLGPDVDTCVPSISVAANVQGADSYEWTTPQGIISGSQTITAAVSGRYTLLVQKADCIQRDSVDVLLDHFTTGEYVINVGDVIVESGDIVLSQVPLTFTNTTTGVSDLVWVFGEGADASGESTAHTYNDPGQYTVILNGTDSRDCPVTVEKNITVVDLIITNAISPNGDGKNDKLFIEPFLYDAELKIVNRWGQSVYEASSYQDDFTGAQLESGVYFYELYLKPIDRRYKGSVSIMK